MQALVKESKLKVSLIIIASCMCIQVLCNHNNTHIHTYTYTCTTNPPYTVLFVTTYVLFVSPLTTTIVYTSMMYFITSSTENDRATYPDLVKFLTDIRDWQALAAHLLPGKSAAAIDKIRSIHNGNVQECKKALFMEYLTIGDKSWSTVMTALVNIGNDDLAEDIKQKLG